MYGSVSARDIAVSGLKAQRKRIDVIANNIANAQTTRMRDGSGPFRRQFVILHGEPLRPTTVDSSKMGVRVERIARDPSPFKMVYDPGHPDANTDGYVAYPNVDVAMEMVNLVVAHRAYDANVAVIASDKRINQRTLDILQI